MGHDTSMLEDGWIIFDGLPMYYRTNALPVPAGARTIIHIHGFGISGTYLLPTAALLADRYATWVPDLPGFGRSIHPPRALTIDDMADAVARFMDAQGIDRAVLLGNSLGCPVTLAFVEQHPDRIEAAVLVSPAGGPTTCPSGVARCSWSWRRARTVGYGADRCPRLPPLWIPQTIALFRSMLHYPVARRRPRRRCPRSWSSAIGTHWSTRRASRRCRRPCHMSRHSPSMGPPTPSTSPHPGQLANVISAFWKAAHHRRSEPAGSGADDPSPVAG